MADQYFGDTARAADSVGATGSMASSASPPGLANGFLSGDASATAMAEFGLGLRGGRCLGSLGHGARDSMARYRGLDAGNVH